MSATDENNDQIEDIPSIFVNSDLFNSKSPKQDFDYSFSNQILSLNSNSHYEDEIITDIEVYVKKIGNDSSLEKAIEDTDSIYSIRKTSHGYVINDDMMYITDNQYNTITTIDNQFSWCAVCDIPMKVNDAKQHKDSLDHNKIMEIYKIFDIYNLTRKMNRYYHCGVCNVVVDFTDLEEHNETRAHVYQKMYFQNKACDYIDEEEYSDSNHGINDFDNDSDIFYSGSDNGIDSNDDDDNDDTSNTIASEVEFIEKNYEDKIVKVRYDTWNMITIFQTNRIYCMACKKMMKLDQKLKHCDEKPHINKLNRCEIVRMFEDHFIRKIDERFFHCGHCNQLQNLYEMETHIEYSQQKRSNQNNNDDHRTQTPIKTDDTTENDDKDIMQNNHDITTNDVKDITNNDKKDITNIDKKDITNIDKKGVTNINKKDVTNIDKKDVTDIDKKNVTNIDKKDVMKNDTLSKLTMSIAPFGTSISVSLLAYNVTCKQVTGDYYCALCNEVFAEEDNVKIHFYEYVHLDVLSRCPYIVTFEYHLIRLIRDVYHCTLCNIPININYITSHIQLPEHVAMFNRVSPPIYNLTNLYNIGAFPPLVSPFGRQPYYPQMPMQRPIVNIPIIPQNNSAPLIITEVPDNSNNLIGIDDKNIDGIDKEVIVDKKDDITQIDKNRDMTKVDKKDDLYDHISTDCDDDVDINDDVYVKHKNFLYKITLLSYNTVNEIGRQFCLVCMSVVNGDLKKHIKSTKHVENMKKFKFIEEYKDHLLRQNHLLYHCAICNVLFPKSLVKIHLDWPTHCALYEEMKDAKKTKRTDIENGLPLVSLGIDKEKEYPNEREPEIKIQFKIENSMKEVKKNCKLIIYKNEVFETKFLNWHSLIETKDNMYKCFLCQTDFDSNELDKHLNSVHKSRLQAVEQQYSDSFLRRINEKLLHCVICNSELPNQESIVSEHIKGKKHRKNYEDTPKVGLTNETIIQHADDIVLIID